MLVFTHNNDGNPLMPCKPSKARRLLKEGKAKVIKRTPFTIKLLFGSSNYVQTIIGGMDAGSKVIGVCAMSKVKCCINPKLILEKMFQEKCNRELCIEELGEVGRLDIDLQDGKIDLILGVKED